MGNIAINEPNGIIDDDQPRARVLAFWKGEEFGPNFEYDLAGTPCGVLYQEGLQIYPNCIQKKFPDDLDLSKVHTRLIQTN